MSEDTLSKVTGGNVVIEGEEGPTGAQAVDRTARGREIVTHTQYVPAPGPVDHDLHRRVETFLFHQAALLDAKDWQGFIDCFTPQGVYWMPVELGQTDWMSQPSIFAEDPLMMEIRMGRLLHPNAWSQAPMWGTNHLVGNVVVEAVHDGKVQVYSRFQMMELRRDDVRHFGGTYRHTLVDQGDRLAIELQRVDLMNGQAAYDYVLQAWV